MKLIFTLALLATTAHADDLAPRAGGIEPGLWKITAWIAQNGVVSPPNQSMKCLTPAETRDLATTFSPVSRTINSECAPIERSFDGTTLSWTLTCKGQLDMEVTGEFTFDSPRHYVATVRTKAAMGGMQMVDTRSMLDAERISECEKPEQENR